MLTISHACLLLLTGAAAADAVDLPLSAANVHWGFFSKTLEPALTVDSGTEVKVEMATHHGCDDYDKMILGDAGMEEIYAWNGSDRLVSKRGATGGGDGVHILTGPIFVNDAEPGDLLKVEILDLQPRPNKDGKTYGSNAAAWWGYQARVPLVDGADFTAGSFSSTPGSNDEVVTIYEILGNYAVPSYQFEWPVMTDPMGEERDYIAYPGTCVPHDAHGATTTVSSAVADMGWTKKASVIYHDDVFPAKIPINYHVGCIGLAPESHDFVDSIPPMPSGGNLDNKRIGVGTTMYCECFLNLPKCHRDNTDHGSCFLPVLFLFLALAIPIVLIKQTLLKSLVVCSVWEMPMPPKAIPNWMAPALKPRLPVHSS
jgi:acetamidase/formamidase